MINEEWGREVAQTVLATDGIESMDARTAGFDLYQHKTAKYAVYPQARRVEYVTLGLTSEAGEVAGKVKKVLRDNNGVLSDEHREQIMAELGDVLWYVSQLCNELGVRMADVADGNIAKLEDRLQRNQIHGSGDNR